MSITELMCITFTSVGPEGPLPQSPVSSTVLSKSKQSCISPRFFCTLVTDKSSWFFAVSQNGSVFCVPHVSLHHSMNSAWHWFHKSLQWIHIIPALCQSLPEGVSACHSAVGLIPGWEPQRRSHSSCSRCSSWDSKLTWKFFEACFGLLRLYYREMNPLPQTFGFCGEHSGSSSNPTH